MQKEKTALTAWPLALVVVAIVGLAGCGGGGNKGAAAPASAALTYTGLSSAATITTTNAQALSNGAVNGTTATGAGAGGALLGVQSVGGGAVGAPSMEQAMENVVTQTVTAQTSGAMFVGAVTAGNTVIAGPCGGSVTANATASGGGSTVSGTLNFNNYCDTDIVFVSGSIGFTALVNGQSIITSLSITTVATAKLSVLARRLGMVFKIETLDITANIQNGVVTLSTVTGSFYHPTYGYVTLSTASSLVIPSGSPYPMSGGLLLTDTLGNRALITALDSNHYQLQIDADHNGTYESTANGLWSSL